MAQHWDFSGEGEMRVGGGGGRCAPPSVGATETWLCSLLALPPLQSPGAVSVAERLPFCV